MKHTDPPLRLTPPVESPEPADPLDHIPLPQELRLRLAEHLRRTDALRRLIRLSERLHPRTNRSGHE